MLASSRNPPGQVDDNNPDILVISMDSEGSPGVYDLEVKNSLMKIVNFNHRRMSRKGYEIGSRHQEHLRNFNVIRFRLRLAVSVALIICRNMGAAKNCRAI